MSLLEKHLYAAEDKDFSQKAAEKIIQSIKEDTTGACWHQEEVFDYTRKQAKDLDSLSREEKIKKPLYGISVGLKDLFCVKHLTTTAGSKILSKFKSPYDSHMWEVLKDKGVLLGAKLAMDEFAMGSFSNTSYLGKVSVPGFPEYSAGGSSGGSGAAVAAKIVDFATGSDTGGSVRLPASFCSVVGYKPSYGVFSRSGMIAYASSLDQAGLLTQSIEDLEYLLSSHITVKDPKDMTSFGLSQYSKESTLSKEWKIGYFPEILEDISVSESVRIAYQKSLERLTLSGAILIPVSIEYMKKAAQIYYIIACSEASSNLARYQGVYFGEKLTEQKYTGTYWEQLAQYRSEFFGIEVQKRIMLGSYILSSENFDSMYQKAVLLRKALKDEFNEIFKQVEQLVLPVSPMVAPTWDKISHMTTAQIYLSDYMTVPFSLAGLPALSLPWFKDKQGLGIGIQFVGNKMSDYELIRRLSTQDQRIETV